MADVLTPEQRHLNMSRIKNRNTKPEIILRKGLHSRGLRFRLHRRDLPGCPDIVFPARRVVIFVHGCFWHGHNCSFFKLPDTRTEFWGKKIARNIERDRLAVEMLTQLGWRVMIVWECSLSKSNIQKNNLKLNYCEQFIKNNQSLTKAELPTSKPVSG